MRWLFLLITHAGALAIGFALGVYFLPVLTAPQAPEQSTLEQSAKAAIYSGTFSRDLPGSDFLHWGEGGVSVSPTQIVHMGRLSPGPDYKAYLVPQFVDDEESFLQVKDQSTYIGDVKTFDGLLLDLPEGTDIETHNTVLIWCETFSEFITAAQYK